MMGKALTGELSCPCDRSCLETFLETCKRVKPYEVQFDLAWHCFFVMSSPLVREITVS